MLHVFSSMKKGAVRVGKGIKQNLPTIGVCAGIGGVVITTALAVHKGRTYDEKVKEELTLVKDLKEAKASGEDVSDDLGRARKELYLKAGKHFAPVIIGATISTGIILAGHVALSRKLLKIGGSLAAVDAFLRTDEEIAEENAEPPIEDGVPREELAVSDADLDILEAKKMGFNECAIRLTPEWSGWIERRAQLLTELLHLEDYTNDLYKSRPEIGLYVSRLYEDLDIEEDPRYRRQVKLGRTHGWLKGYGDDYVDFGLRERPKSKRYSEGEFTWTLQAQAFLDGRVNYLWINPNVSGMIIDKI